MYTPLDVLFGFISQLRDLDLVQEWIQEVRIMVPTDQLTQLHMDRRQEELDAKREQIKLTMFEISSMN
jgi:hypothetical protein